MTSRHHDGHAWKEAAQAHFHRWAEHYDRDIINVLLFEPCYRRVMCQLRHWQRRGRRGLRILDVGCGTGTMTLRLPSVGPIVAEAVGLDMSSNMIAKAQEKAQAQQLTDKVQFVEGDAEHLPFDDDSFDLVTCCNSFHHYPHQDQALKEMRRVLRPAGQVLLLDGYRDNPLGWLIFDVGVERAEKLVHHCSAERFRDLFRTAGFDELNQRVFGVCPPVIFNHARLG